MDYSSYLDTRGAIFLTIFVRMYADQDYVVYIDVWIKTFAVQVNFSVQEFRLLCYNIMD